MQKFNMKEYGLKLFLACALAALSLIYNSLEGIIGSFLISPFVISILMMTVNFEMGFSIFVMSIVFCVAMGYTMDKMFDRDLKKEGEIMKRIYEIDVGLTFLMSFICGLVFVMSSTKSLGFGTMELAGAAIAISFMPPLVNAGILYSKNMDSHANISMKIALINIFGVLSAVGFMKLFNGDIIKKLDFLE